MSVCTPCRTAGTALQLIRTQPEMDPEAKERALQKVKEGHDLCRGSTWCDCQHSRQEKTVETVS
jgi:hypothetical protein